MEAKHTMTTKYIVECSYKLHGEVRPAYFRHHLQISGLQTIYLVL